MRGFMSLTLMGWPIKDYHCINFKVLDSLFISTIETVDERCFSCSYKKRVRINVFWIFSDGCFEIYQYKKVIYTKIRRLFKAV